MPPSQCSLAAGPARRSGVETGAIVSHLEVRITAVDPQRDVDL